jgi:hypothetical protein
MPLPHKIRDRSQKFRPPERKFETGVSVGLVETFAAPIRKPWTRAGKAPRGLPGDGVEALEQALEQKEVRPWRAWQARENVRVTG